MRYRPTVLSGAIAERLLAKLPVAGSVGTYTHSGVRYEIRRCGRTVWDRDGSHFEPSGGLTLWATVLVDNPGILHTQTFAERLSPGWETPLIYGKYPRAVFRAVTRLWHKTRGLGSLAAERAALIREIDKRVVPDHIADCDGETYRGYPVLYADMSTDDIAFWRTELVAWPMKASDV